jgi:uncharacterized cysteine cluster protein YcgN (CxxCxxCC family)
MINFNSLPRVLFSKLYDLPKVSGIYLALASDDDVLYIGQAKNINKRWESHHRKSDLEKFNCTQIAWFPIQEEFLNIAERDALLQLRPLLNGVSMWDAPSSKRSTVANNLDAELTAILTKFYGADYTNYKPEDLVWSEMYGSV